MIIPPSVMLIIYAVVTEQSVGAMFLAGVLPGILLAVAFCASIMIMAIVAPKFVVRVVSLRKPAVRSANWAATIHQAGASGPAGGSGVGWDLRRHTHAGRIRCCRHRGCRHSGCHQGPPEHQGHLGGTGRHRAYHCQHPLPIIAASIYSRMLGIAEAI